MFSDRCKLLHCFLKILDLYFNLCKVGKACKLLHCFTQGLPECPEFNSPEFNAADVLDLIRPWVSSRAQILVDPLDKVFKDNVFSYKFLQDVVPFLSVLGFTD